MERRSKPRAIFLTPLLKLFGLSFVVHRLLKAHLGEENLRFMICPRSFGCFPRIEPCCTNLRVIDRSGYTMKACKTCHWQKHLLPLGSIYSNKALACEENGVGYTAFLRKQYTCAHMLKSQNDNAVLWALSSGLLRRVGLLLRYIILAKFDMKAAWSICLPQGIGLCILCLRLQPHTTTVDTPSSHILALCLIISRA